MKKLAKKALQMKQTVKGYDCTAACQSICQPIPTHDMAASGWYNKKRGTN